MASVEPLFGPLLIGVLLNAILYGVLVVQTFLYYQVYKKDAAWIKYLVLYLFIVDTLNTGFDIGIIYEPLVLRYGTERALTISPTMLPADAIVTVMVSTPVQLFIAWRIKVISHSSVVASIVVFFAICSFIGGIATTISVTLLPEFAKIQQFKGAVITWLAASAIADVIITLSLVWNLSRRKTGFKSTDDQISRIIRLTIQTGAVTSTAAVVDIIVFLSLPKTSTNFVFGFALSKLYTNSLLSTLNARGGWKRYARQVEDTNVLFGTREESEETSVASGRATSTIRGNRRTANNGVYELEHRTSSKPDTRYDSQFEDLEHGITMTKVVERMEGQDSVMEEHGSQ